MTTQLIKGTQEINGRHKLVATEQGKTYAMVNADLMNHMPPAVKGAYIGAMVGLGLGQETTNKSRDTKANPIRLNSKDAYKRATGQDIKQDK